MTWMPLAIWNDTLGFRESLRLLSLSKGDTPALASLVKRLAKLGWMKQEFLRTCEHFEYSGKSS